MCLVTPAFAKALQNKGCSLRHRQASEATKLSPSYGSSRKAMGESGQDTSCFANGAVLLSCLYSLKLSCCLFTFPDNLCVPPDKGGTRQERHLRSCRTNDEGQFNSSSHCCKVIATKITTHRLQQTCLFFTYAQSSCKQEA